MEILRNKYLNEYDIQDINFMVVNANNTKSLLFYLALDWRISFPLYQDTPRSLVWHRLLGQKDDFLIYDRCGQLTYHIKLPYSYLAYPYVELAINASYSGIHPCNCSADDDDDTDYSEMTSLVYSTETATTLAMTTLLENVVEDEDVGPAYELTGDMLPEEANPGADHRTDLQHETGEETEDTSPDQDKTL